MANTFNDFFFCGIGHKYAEKFNNSLPEIEQLMPRGFLAFQPFLSVLLRWNKCYVKFAGYRVTCYFCEVVEN